jgi:hypothetical protein
MIHHTCFKCKRRFELDPVLVGFELSKLKKKNPSFYQAVCPACRAMNKVSVSAMQAELDSVADEIQKMIAEEQASAEEQAKREEEAKSEKEVEPEETAKSEENAKPEKKAKPKKQESKE